MHAGSVITVGDKLPELLSKLKKTSSFDIGTLKGKMNSAVTPLNKILDTSEIQTLHLKNGQTPLSLMPQTSISSKSSSANGDIPRHSVDNSQNDTRLPGKSNVHVADDAHVLNQSPEEIVIDDSDDDVMEIEDSALSRTSKSSVQYSHRGLSTERESQVHS